jgi:hypothetical protein
MPNDVSSSAATAMCFISDLLPITMPTSGADPAGVPFERDVDVGPSLERFIVGESGSAVFRKKGSSRHFGIDVLRLRLPYNEKRSGGR